MTIEELIYVAVSVVFETLYLGYHYKNLKKKLVKNESLSMFKMMMQHNDALKALKKKVLNWYTITFVSVIWIVLCPFLMPVTLLFILKRFVFGKSKSEKKAEKDLKEMEDGHAKAKEWMKNEGRDMASPHSSASPFGDDHPNFTIRNEENSEK